MYGPWTGDGCGTRRDRDVNVAINIKNEGLRILRLDSVQVLSLGTSDTAYRGNVRQPVKRLFCWMRFPLKQEARALLPGNERRVVHTKILTKFIFPHKFAILIFPAKIPPMIPHGFPNLFHFFHNFPQVFHSSKRFSWGLALVWGILFLNSRSTLQGRINVKNRKQNAPETLDFS